MSSYYRVKGCIHIHFPISLMERGIELISESANKAGIDFAIVTSHIPEKNLEKYEKILDLSGYYKNVLIISGQETNDKNKKNHLIIAGEKKWYKKKERIEDTIEELKDKNVISIVAHPYGSHRLFFKKKNYHWENWENRFDCVEVWSLLFDWASTTSPFNLPLRYFSFPGNLKGPDRKALVMWDKISRNRKITAIAGLDIHMLPSFLKFFDVKKNFLYTRTFSILRNHLFLKEKLSGNFDEDKDKIFKALKRGNLYFANDFLKDSNGFYFGEVNGAFIMGDEGKPGQKILVEVPYPADIRIIKDGKIFITKTGKFIEYKAEEKGNYRVEVFYNKNPWIFSNMIYFHD